MGKQQGPGLHRVNCTCSRYLLIAKQIIVLTLTRTAVDLGNKENAAERAAQWGCGRSP